VGPIAGVALAVLIFKLVVALEYETAQFVGPPPELILPIANLERPPSSSIIPMASVGPSTPEKDVQEPLTEHM